MAILGFLVLMAVALYMLIGAVGLLAAISAFGGTATEKVVGLGIILAALCLAYVAFVNAPFAITFTA